MNIPSSIAPFLLQFSLAFTESTFRRFSILMLSAILTMGRRIVSNLLRTAPALAPGHASSYHRVFSRRRWSLWKLGYAMTRWAIVKSSWGGKKSYISANKRGLHGGYGMHYN